MSPKPSITIDNHCQHISPKGQRCHMLIDENHRPANGAKRSTLCAYHANRLSASVPAVEPEVLAADLLGDIDDFSTAGSVNLFLGNLVKQLARKRIARRDAIALAYLSQLLLNSIRALDRQFEAEKEAEDIRFASKFLLQGLGSPRNSSSSDQPSPTTASAQASENVPRAS
jgi:hypothetical protein